MAGTQTPEQRAATLPDGASVKLVLDGGEVLFPMDARAFSSGSIGYWAGGKLQGEDGRKYQVNMTAVLIGSRPAAKQAATK